MARVWPGRVLHVVGATEMAEQLRSLYGTGEITGWSLQPMAGTRTPLHTVEQRIRDAAGGTGRGYPPLARGGFVHTEEVQATPDAALLGVRNVGPNTLPIIRKVLPYTGPAVDEAAELPPTARERLNAPERQAELDELFTATTRARYRRLVDGLVGSRGRPAQDRRVPQRRGTPARRLARRAAAGNRRPRRAAAATFEPSTTPDGCQTMTSSSALPPRRLSECR
ncbi:hypothetical protein [Amycolatopsis sp. NBC_01286]|uniref:hypothetical protein n=1 Tax=Amycolatopsis sp. NBC_01286 TaxID=2903560 RepID=UPI002E152272|nr:hypothetical protein OG570_16985 [Amycolatopsis sp. NBC_01286]